MVKKDLLCLPAIFACLLFFSLTQRATAQPVSIPNPIMFVTQIPHADDASPVVTSLIANVEAIFISTINEKVE